MASIQSAEAGEERQRLLKTRRAVRSGFFGSMLEYYDFVVYGSAAAVVFNRVFFPQSDAAAGILLSLATFGIAYVARPVGALIWGHFGDRIGRKRVMMLTVVLMGAATFAIGLLPDYNVIGVGAPVLLVILRLCQGISAGGEQAGAAAVILETAPKARRGYYASFVQEGTVAGTVLGTAVFIPVSTLPDDALLSWGWRIPFLLSAVVVVIAYMIRRTLEEPATFLEIQKKERVARIPLFELLRTHPWAVLRLIGCALIAAIGSTFTVFSVTYGVNTFHVDRTAMLWLTSTANLVALITLPLYARLSDRIGRKAVFMGGTVATAAATFLYLYSVSTASLPFMFVAGIIMYSGCYISMVSLVAFFPEMFNTKVRYSGSSLGTQIGYMLAGFAPTIGYAIVQPGTAGWVPVGVMVAIICAIAFAAAAAGRETNREEIETLGSRKRDESVAASPTSVPTVES